ncbi:MAG: hypothetical protein WKF58_11640 [Ilumatobacteraceae bacterium]
MPHCWLVDTQHGQKLTLVGLLALAGYEVYGIARVIGALTLGVEGEEVAKRDRLYQLEALANPVFVGLVLLAALVAVVVLSQISFDDAQAKLLLMAAKVTAGAAALLVVALAISLATDDRFDDRWARLVGVLAGLPVAAAVLLLPQGTTTTPTRTRTSTQPSASSTTGEQATAQQPTTQQPFSPPGAAPRP